MNRLPQDRGDRDRHRPLLRQPGGRRRHPSVGDRRDPRRRRPMPGDRKDLGIHSEMISDGILDLCEKGVITGREKTLDKGEIVVTFLMGTRRLYDFVNHNPVVKVLPVDYVNNPLVIMQQRNMVSINAALKVDLMGQVSAESIGLKQFSGVGGQVDFVRGVAMSENGKAIIAMPSLARKRRDDSFQNRAVSGRGRGGHHFQKRRGLYCHRVWDCPDERALAEGAGRQPDPDRAS